MCVSVPPECRKTVMVLERSNEAVETGEDEYLGMMNVKKGCDFRSNLCKLYVLVVIAGEMEVGIGGRLDVLTRRRVVQG